MIYDNGNIYEKINKINLRVKGKASRYNYQKNWIIKFDKPFYNLNRIGLKGFKKKFKFKRY
jgi:hypothetical protein